MTGPDDDGQGGDYSDYDPRNPKWDSDAALERLSMEKAYKPDETNEQLTKRLLEEAAPAAASSIIHLALHGTNENTRLNASRYITDNLLTEGASATRAKWEDLVGMAVSEAEIYANENES